MGKEHQSKIHIFKTLQQCIKENSGQTNYTDDTKAESCNRTMLSIPIVKEKLLVQKPMTT